MRPETGSETVDAILYAAHRVRTAADAALREHGLSLPGLKLLKALGAGDRSMREISQVLHVSPRTITDMIDSLEVRGLVTRCPHPTDRRVTLLHRTDAGTREQAVASTGAERVAAAAISALDQHEQHLLHGLLERVCVPAAAGRDGVPAVSDPFRPARSAQTPHLSERRGCHLPGIRLIAEVGQPSAASSTCSRRRRRSSQHMR